MNIFEIENLIKKIENEDIRFPRIDRVKNYEKVRVHRDNKEDVEIQEVRRINFKLENKILDMMNDFTAQIVEDNANTIDNWIIKQLGEFGVSESEIFDRVSMYASGITPLHQTNHVFIDGNKRTSVIFSNHYLISKGKGIIAIPFPFEIK